MPEQGKNSSGSIPGRIQAPDAQMYARIRHNWDGIAKPLDGMGRFEEFHARIGAIQAREQPDVTNGAVLVFCADNGIVEEGVSQSTQEVTRACAVNMGKGRTAVGAMAKAAGVRVVPVDIGIAEAGTGSKEPAAGDRAGKSEGSETYCNERERKEKFALELENGKDSIPDELENGKDSIPDELENGKDSIPDELENGEDSSPGELEDDKDSIPSEWKEGEGHIPGMLNRKVVPGTRNFLKEPAMTPRETQKAIETGIRLVADLRQEGVSILGLGELGIGNTTTSACVAAALLGCDPALAVGRGAGLSDSGLQRKKEVAEKALTKWGFRSDFPTGAGPEGRQWKYDDEAGTARIPGQPLKKSEQPVALTDPGNGSGTRKEPDPMKVLQTVGGLDIAGMCGACIGGARYHVPIVLDGVISMTAALVAQRLVPGIRDYLIPSHMSREPAAALIANELKLSPVLDADMALGEGTGAVMMLSLLKLADSVYRHCVRFGDSGVEAYQRYDK